MKVKEENEKAGLNLNIQKMKIMAPSPITSWQIDGEKVETVSDFIFLGSKITADGDCSHKIKRYFLLATWKNNYDKPRQSIKKQTSFCQQTSMSAEALQCPAQSEKMILHKAHCASFFLNMQMTH